MTPGHLDAVRDAQPVLAEPGRASHVLVVTLLPGADDLIRDLCSDLSRVVGSVGSRDQETETSCVVGFSYDAWRRVSRRPAPAGMRPFEPVHGVTQTAPATPGEVLFHVRAARRDLCFEVVMHLTAALRGAVRIDLDVQAFRYFDNRNLLGFVDSSENPRGPAAVEAAIIGPEGAEHAGGSFALVQTYLHDLRAWSQLHVCEQERVIGREKLSNLPLRGARPEHAVLHCNMAFGSPALDEFGTLSVGYSASCAVLETMLRTRFVGVPTGRYHPVLDFSTAVSGGLFYAPPATLMRSLSTRFTSAQGSGSTGRSSDLVRR